MFAFLREGKINYLLFLKQVKTALDMLAPYMLNNVGLQNNTNSLQNRLAKCPRNLQSIKSLI